MVSLTKYSWTIIYLYTTGAIKEEDLYLFLYVEPRIAHVLENYSTFSKKYRESTIISYLSDLMSKFRKEDIFSQLKLIVPALATAPEAKLKILVPHLAEILATLERRAHELGIMDSRLEKAFERVYEAMYRDKPKIGELVTHIARLATLIEKAERAMVKEIKTIEPQKIHKRPPPAKLSEDLLKEFVKLVYEYNKKGKKPLLAEILQEFFNKFADKLTSVGDAYVVYREALRRKYVKEIYKKLEVTPEGKNFIGES